MFNKYLQSLKRSTFQISLRTSCAHSAFTVSSMCVHLRSPLRFVRAHRSQSAHRVPNVRSHSFYLVFTVRSAFTYRSVRFHLF